MMNTQFLHDEAVVIDGAANLQRGIETLGGWLYLTDRRLIFEVHKWNFQKQDEIINLEDIAFVQNAWTFILNIIPIYPNSIVVSMKQGIDYRFVVSNRKDWIEMIQKYIS